MEEVDKGWLMIRICVTGWTFLLAPAHAGSVCTVEQLRRITQMFFLQTVKQMCAYSTFQKLPENTAKSSYKQLFSRFLITNTKSCSTVLLVELTAVKNCQLTQTSN